MKVDVEGAEDLVVRGGISFLGDHKRRPRIILMELFDGNLSSFDTSVDSVIARMSSFGYQPHILKGNGSRLYPYETSTHAAFYNVIFLPNPS
jgi:hypothetical protein